MQSSSRRQFLHGAGLGLFGFSVAGLPALLSPRQARARGAELKVLSKIEASLLEAVGEAFAPGAAEAGIAWFVDQQLSISANDSLLMARYFNVPPPYTGFYQASLAAIDRLSHARHDQPFTGLDSARADSLIRELLGGAPDGWQGPPALVVYLVLRNDAVDVVYGTPEGFAQLGVPYMAHVMPPSRW